MTTNKLLEVEDLAKRIAEDLGYFRRHAMTIPNRNHVDKPQAEEQTLNINAISE